jgi:hypothetical protein
MEGFPEEHFGDSPKETGPTPLPPRLAVGTVELLHRLLAGDGLSEAMILRFIQDRWGAPSLLYLPPGVATEALRRPADFIQAAKQHCQPELNF